MCNQQGPQGAPGLVYRGAYDGLILYNKNDVITYGGSTYVALTTAGGFPPTSFLNQTAHEWALLAAQGATGAQGVAGPTGPTGPPGPASTLAYTINFYSHTLTVKGGTGVPPFNVASDGAVCHVGELPIAASCGYQSSVETHDQRNLSVNYAGLDPSNASASLCLFTNTSTDARNTTVGVSCLAQVNTGNAAAAQVVKSCTYNPDTQPPCTEADATVYDPVADKAQALARVEALNAAGPAVPSTGGTPKVQRSVTRWFRD